MDREFTIEELMDHIGTLQRWSDKAGHCPTRFQVSVNGLLYVMGQDDKFIPLTKSFSRYKFCVNGERVYMIDLLEWQDPSVVLLAGLATPKKLAKFADEDGKVLGLHLAAFVPTSTIMFHPCQFGDRQCPEYKEMILVKRCDVRITPDHCSIEMPVILEGGLDAYQT